VEHSNTRNTAVEKTAKKSVVREYGEAILIALLAALFLRAFVVQAFKIPSGSMIPTLQIGDHILVNKMAYGIRAPDINWLPFVGCDDLFQGSDVVEWDTPKRGDVVVFVYPRDRCKDFIKRVIGVPGDTVEIRNKRVYINGKPVKDEHAYYDDPHIEHGVNRIRDNFGPVRVPPNHIFVMGDNRDRSYDSRFWGFVPIKDVRGRAFIKYFSWDSDDSKPRWTSIGNLIY
jgi:signal peptidase I